MKKIEEIEEIESMQGIDSRALFATFITKLPWLFLLAVAGAVLGSVLNLVVVLGRMQDICYVSETEYYIQFAEGQYEAKNYYNAFTWNDVLATDQILGRAMEILGNDYDRNQVKTMITAEIYSDVRYLTVYVRGKEPAQVEEIKNALEIALGEFGIQKKEFDAIYKIEDLEIVQEEIPYFGWRAAFLGAVIAVGIGVFGIAFCFCMGSTFYTKRDITVRLGLPVCGMTFREGHYKNRSSALEQRQAEMLWGSLEKLQEKYGQILLMDASGGQEAALFLQDICSQELADSSVFELYHTKEHMIGWEHEDRVALAVIPFGTPYREKMADEIDYVRLHGGRVAAAVLVQADRRWMQIYYA